MARAAAKRRRPSRPDAHKRRHKDSGGHSVEQTLFFNRLRRQAKWVFVFLAVVFGGGFVVFGVGSSVGGSLSDIFQGIHGGGSGGPSISKALKETQRSPNKAKAWRDLGEAYELDGQVAPAAAAWEQFVKLRPRNVDGLTRLAALYERQVALATDRARAAAFEVQGAQTSPFGPPPSSPLGQALASVPDPISQAVTTGANQRYNDALAIRQNVLTKLVATYQKTALLQPSEPSAQLQLATAAQNAGDATTAILAYERFVKLAPDDPNAPYAKQQITALQKQLADSSGS